MAPCSRRELLARLAASASSSSLLAMPGASMAQAAPPPEVAMALPGAKLLGQGRLTFFGLHVYDARLWAPEAFKPSEFDKAPLALELEYARTLYGSQIADRSLTEMKRSGDIPAEKADRWLASMKKLMPDVAKGDRITGVQVPGVATQYFVNGKLRGEIRDAEFTQLFFGIWLSPRSSEPKLREALLAGAKSTP